MVSVILVPAEIWHHPSYDAIYHGFDPNLVYTNTEGPSASTGTVNVTSDSILIESPPNSQPTVTLLTTPLSFQVYFLASFQSIAQNATPLTAGIWSPEESAGYFVVFGGGSNRTITAEALSNGTVGTSLVGGRAAEIEELGTYSEMDRLLVAITVDRQSQTITNHIVSESYASGEPIVNASSTLSAQELPALFRSVRLSLTLSSSSQSGTTKVALNNYELALPSERWLAYTIDDPYANIIVISLLIAGGVICSIQLANPVRKLVHGLKQSIWRANQQSARNHPRIHCKRMWVWIASGTLYMVVSSLFFNLGNAQIGRAHV